MSEIRVGHPEWHLVEVSGHRTGPGEGDSSFTGEIKLNLFPQQDEAKIALGLRVEVVIPELVGYVVHIVGAWDKAEKRPLGEKELKEALLGYRLDELAAVVNFEFSHLASRFRTTAPYVPQEQLQAIREGNLS